MVFISAIMLWLKAHLFKYDGAKAGLAGCANNTLQ